MKAIMSSNIMLILGGHINSAVSLAMAILGKISWVKLPVYLAAQHLGAFLGAAVVFGIYYGGTELLESLSVSSFIGTFDLQTRFSHSSGSAMGSLPQSPYQLTPSTRPKPQWD